MTYDCLLEREAWLGGGGGGHTMGGGGACDAATRHHICISFVLRPSVSLQSCDASSAALEQAERTAESC